MKSRKIILLIIACISLTINAISQGKIITGNQFHSATSVAIEKSQVFPRRQIVTEKGYSNGNLIETRKLTWEAISYEELKITETIYTNGTITKFEEIRIGDNVYKRKDDGEWEKIKWRFKQGKTREVLEFLYCNEFSLEMGNYKKQSNNIFQQFSIEADDTKRLFYEQKKYWISGNGVLLKEELVLGQLNPKNISSQKTIVYEYDSKIKIEAPILGKDKL